MSQYYFLSSSLSCFDLSVMCCFHVNLLSRVMPRYLTVSLLGTVILLMVTCGQVCFRSVKVDGEQQGSEDTTLGYARFYWECYANGV